MNRLALLLAVSCACAGTPPERVELEARLGKGPARRIVLYRGAIHEVSPVKSTPPFTAHPGRFALWDSTPLPTPRDLVALVGKGYTSVVLAALPLADSIALRDYAGTGRSRGPRVFVSGPELSSTLPEDATTLRYRVRVQDAAAVGAEFVVIELGAGPSVVCAVTEEARRQKVQVWLRGSGTELSSVQSECRADAVWVQDQQTVVPPRDLTSGVWIVAANHPLPNDPPILAHFGSEDAPAAVSGAAQTLNVEDAVGQIAPGYRGDLVVQGPSTQRVFIDGVEQTPVAPWYAGLALRYARWQVRLPPED